MEVRKLTLYTTPSCPRCKVLKMKLDKKNLEYNEISDVDVLLSKGIKQAPVLEINGELLNMSQANDYINSL